MIGYLVDAYNAFGLRKSMDASATLRAVVSIPILIEGESRIFCRPHSFAHRACTGWIVSWSSLQALLLATDHHARPLLRPVLANGLFVGGGIVILIVVIVVAVLNAVVANEVWHQSQHVIALMRTNERAWTPETNVLPQLLELQPLYAELARQGAKLRQVSIAQIGILLFVPLIVIFINIGSLRLAALIRTQITFNVSQCLGDRRETRYSGGGAFENTVATARSRGKEEAMEGKIASKLTQARPSILADSFSRQELRFLATRRGSGAETRAQVRTIQKLQKARRDLVTTSCTIACAIVLILALSILVFVIYIRYDDPSQIPFPYVSAKVTRCLTKADIACHSQQEAILLGIAYIFGFFITVVQLVLIYNLFSARKLGGTSSTDSISGLTTGTQPLPTRHMTSESASSVHFLSSPIPGGATSGVVPAIEWSLHPKEGSEASEKLV